MKHPFSYILFALVVVLAALGFSQLVLHYAHTTFLWVLLIVLLVTGIAAMAMNMLFYAQRINPRMKLLPPPFKF